MKKIIITIVITALVIIASVFGIMKYLEIQKQQEQERLQAEKEKQEMTEALDIAIEGIDIFYEHYIKLQYENPNYYKSMADSTNAYDLMNQWDAIVNTDIKDIDYQIDDFNEVLEGCEKNEKCDDDENLQDLFKDMRRSLDTHKEALVSWQEDQVYEGNELFSSLSLSTSDIVQKVKGLSSDYSEYISTEQQEDLSKFDDSEIFNAIQAKYFESLSYCSKIDPIFHAYKRYETLCATTNASSFIELNPMQSYFYEEPIVFTGRVSENTTKIIITAKGSSYSDDNYELTSFNSGDSTFTYRAKMDFNNLAYGENIYYFVAHFDDGTTSTEEIIIYYYGNFYY